MYYFVKSLINISSLQAFNCTTFTDFQATKCFSIHHMEVRIMWNLQLHVKNTNTWDILYIQIYWYF